MHHYGIFSLVVVMLSSHLDLASGANILVAMPIPARSHFKSYQPLFEELIRRGHNLTIISFVKLPDIFGKNYTHIDVSHLTIETIGISFAKLREQSGIETVKEFSKVLFKHTEMVLREPGVKHLLESDDIKFDLVMVEIFYMDVYVAFGNYFKAPVIALSAQEVISVYKWIFGNPLSISHVPQHLLPFTDKMSFSERLWNVYYILFLNLYYEYESLPKSQEIMEKHFPFQDGDRVPKIRNMMKNISLILGNYHFTYGYVAPFLPNFIETAGLHMTEPELLPNDIQKFMDDATQGVIYISLGSLIQPDHVGSMGETFINALKDLPLKVILKWNPKSLSSKPSNFLVQEWLPQNSILMHRNCRLFITHGGLHSILESINYSVPLIGIPFFNDQQRNIALVEKLGIGRRIHFSFTEDQLFNAVQEVLIDLKYSENIKLVSSRFNDRLVSPLNTAVYWVEYVLRHKDLQFLRPASADLSLYQEFMLDVLLFIFLAISLFLLSFYFIMKLLFYCRAIFSSNTTHPPQTTSKNIKTQ